MFKITQFFSGVGRKRKPVEAGLDEENGSTDELAITNASSQLAITNSLPKKQIPTDADSHRQALSPLSEVSPRTNASPRAKRRRVLKCVAIPVRNPTSSPTIFGQALPRAATRPHATISTPTAAATANIKSDPPNHALVKASDDGRRIPAWKRLGLELKSPGTTQRSPQSLNRRGFASGRRLSSSTSVNQFTDINNDGAQDDIQREKESPIRLPWRSPIKQSQNRSSVSLPASETTDSPNTPELNVESNSQPSNAKQKDSSLVTIVTDDEDCEDRAIPKKPINDRLSRPRRSANRVSYVEVALSDTHDSEKDGYVSDSSEFSAAAMVESESESESDVQSEVNFDTDGDASSAMDIDFDNAGEEDVIEVAASPIVKATKRVAKSSGTSGAPKAVKYVDLSLPPLDNIEDIFADMASNALKLGLDEALKDLKGRPINVATMCSGTESPLIALQLLSKALERSGQAALIVEHHFSAEIDAFKQSFIERNFQPKKLFRDVREFIPDDAETATTAYGAEVPIPRELDILIAGFVCKDLSRLNSRPKGLDEGGESGDTWSGVYSYARRFQPSIVLIENVQNVKEFWNTFKKKWADIGYSSTWLYFDSKNFYLPQTRQRMYMVAIKNDLYGRNVQGALEKWEDVFTKLKRQCSSPFDAFLADDADQHIHTARPNEVEWALCKLRHDRLRTEERLGTKRPVSQWSENGSVRPPDFASRTWYQSQSTRVYDAIDIAHLQAAASAEPYDSLYKMMVWDVSQNVDRFKSTTGVVPCITPSGIDFMTSKQTAMNGTQLLLLQGMPTSKLLFAGETQRDRQDLAGNAMSTTVIGAAIVAALISARRSFRTVKAQKSEIRSTAQKAHLLTVESMDKAILMPPNLETLDLAEFVEDSRLSSRLCNCEGSKQLSKSPIHVCNSCDHTACLACSGHPKHAYRETILRDERIRPSEFERVWRPRLPARINMNNFPNLRKLDADIAFAQRVAEADVNSNGFSISKFQRMDRHWRVTYLSPHAKLELHVYGQNQIYWYLYVDCPPTIPGNSSLRRSLGHPVARAHVKKSLLEPEWEVFIPQVKGFGMAMTGSSQRSSSWRSRLGLLDHKAETVPTSFDVDCGPSPDIGLSGRYALLPHCGTAMSSLYRRSDGVCLFLDPDPLGPAKSDTFVFAKDSSRLPYGESRVILAKLEPTWRPWSVKGTVDVNATLPGDWISAELNLSTDTLPVIARVPSATAVSAILGDCSRAVNLLDARLDASLETREFSGYSWALEHAKLRPALSNWAQYRCEDTNTTCLCAPPLPRTLWSVNKDGEAEAHEDQKSAALFERAVKTRNPIFEIRAASDTKGTYIQVGINLTSLVHRARGRLRQFPNCTTAWRVITDHVDSAWEPFDKFTLQDNSKDLPYSGKLHLEHSLVEAQRKALAWMRNQELGVPLSITEVEEEVHAELGWRVEARAEAEVTIRGGVLADLPSFGKTVTTIALVHSEFEEMDADAIVDQNSRTKPVQALLESAATLIVCPPHIAKQWREEFLNFLGNKQYKEYGLLLIETFDQLEVLTIEDVQRSRVIILAWKVFADERYIAHLARFAAVPEPATSKGRAFDAWIDFVVEQLPERVQELKTNGVTEFEGNIDKTLKARLEHPEFKATVPLKVLHGSAYQSHKKVSNTKKSRSATAVTTRPKIKTSANTKWPSYPALLQMFRFNRVVIDEYHYLFEDKSNYAMYSAVKRIAAHKRWLLSGTPALGQFSDVNQIASLLGATLGRPSAMARFGQSTTTTKFEQKLLADQTSVEKFLSQIEVMSYQWHKARHDRAQKFLDQFVRQNEPLLDHIAYTELLRPIELDVAHHAVYLELSQHLIAQKMQVKRLKPSDKSDRTNRLHASLDNCRTAEEALVKSALLFKTLDGESGLETLIQKREQQIKQTKVELFRLMSEAESFQKRKKTKDEFYHGLKQGVRSGDKLLGDKEAHQIMLKLFTKAEREAASSKNTQDMKRLTSDLGGLANELVLRIRSLRFIESIKAILPDLPALSDTHLCSAEACSGCELSELFVVSDCGHLACPTCLDAREDSGSCIVKDCDVSIHGPNLVKVSCLGSHFGKVTDESFGKKLDAISGLIKQIPDEDQVIVFVPNEEAILIMEEVFDYHDISCSTVSKKKTGSAKLIEDFKTNKNIATRKKVLILNLLDESASGVNLVNANHVIFVSPLLAETQYKYDSAMVQAIARSRRYGQKKKVHIYHFAALRTIDVDILEHRHKRDGPLHLDPDTQPQLDKLPKKEKTRLIRTSGGALALVPISILADETKRRVLGVEEEEEHENFTSLIHFSDTFQDDDD